MVKKSLFPIMMEYFGRNKKFIYNDVYKNLTDVNLCYVERMTVSLGEDDMVNMWKRRHKVDYLHQLLWVSFQKCVGVNMDIMNASLVLPNFRNMIEVVLYSPPSLRSIRPRNHVRPLSMLVCYNLQSIILQDLHYIELPEWSCGVYELNRFSVDGCPRLRKNFRNG